MELTRDLRLSVDLNAYSSRQNLAPYLNNDLQNLPPYQLLLDANGNYQYDYTKFNVAVNRDITQLGYLDNGMNLLEESAWRITLSATSASAQKWACNISSGNTFRSIQTSCSTG